MSDENELIRAILNERFNTMKRNAQILAESTKDLQQKSEKSGSAFSVRSFTFANRPLAVDGMTGFALAFITDGRKTAEGAGAGTGVLSYYNIATNTWLRASDDGTVAT